MNVLVTGSAGFVGSHLVRALMPDHHVVSVTRDRTREPPGHVVAYGDIVDQDFCRRIVADYEIDLVYHLAAQSIVSTCAQDPIAALEIAVMGTARLLQAVRDVGRPVRTIAMTSDKVFGSAPPPYTELTPLDARHAYEVSKACQDLVARMYFHNFGVDVRVVRAVNIYGPGDPNLSRLIPQTVARVLRGEPPLLHAGASSMRRQYVHVADLVRALKLIASAGRAGEAYCVGGHGPPLTPLEVMREICRQAGVEMEHPEVQARAKGFVEIQQQWVDDHKIRALGWKPEIDFLTGIGTVLEEARRVRVG